MTIRSLPLALLLVLVALMTATPTSAQTPTPNPRFIEFQSPDHNIVTRYEVGYFFEGAPSPVQTVSLPQAEFTAQPEAYWRHALPRPVFGTFTAKARAVAVGAGPSGPVDVFSEWSNPSGPFLLSPLAPAGLRTPQ